METSDKTTAINNETSAEEPDFQRSRR